MKTDVIDKTGKPVEKINISDRIFGLKPNEVLLGQYVRSFMLSKRRGTSSTKTRSEVSGTGRKPWRQKGTGRARVGSTRNPLWRHGGISHGPKPKEWRLTVLKKVKRNALFSAISSKFSAGSITVLDKIVLNKYSTKSLVALLNGLKRPSKLLLVIDKNDQKIVKSVKNIPELTVSLVKNLNAYDVLNAKKVIFVKDAIESLEAKYL